MGYPKVGALPVHGTKLISCRYYHQRYSVFSRYDEGIWMTDDAWFGVTPEPVAKLVKDQCITTFLTRQ
jgi:hypothetical protein